MFVSSQQRQRDIYWALRNQLLEELRSCHGLDGKGVPEKMLQDLEGIPKGEFDASDLFRIDVATFEYLSDHELRMKVVGYRGLLENLLSREAYAALAPQFCSDLGSRGSLLDEARALASRMYRRYVLVPEVEELRADIAKKLFFAVAAILALFLWVDREYGLVVDGYLFAAAAGAAGGTMSTIVRLFQVDSRHEPLLTWMNLERGKPSLWVSPVLGAVFGMALVLLITARLLEGSLFPAFDDPHLWRNLDPVYSVCAGNRPIVVPDGSAGGTMGDPCVTLATDLAKLLIWAFIAGWAERLIPDVLNRLSVIEPRHHEELRHETPVVVRTQPPDKETTAEKPRERGTQPMELPVG